MKPIRLHPTMSDVMAVQMALLNARRALLNAKGDNAEAWIDYADSDVQQAFQICSRWYKGETTTK